MENWKYSIPSVRMLSLRQCSWNLQDLMARQFSYHKDAETKQDVVAPVTLHSLQLLLRRQQESENYRKMKISKEEEEEDDKYPGYESETTSTTCEEDEDNVNNPSSETQCDNARCGNMASSAVLTKNSGKGYELDDSVAGDSKGLITDVSRSMECSLVMQSSAIDSEYHDSSSSTSSDIDAKDSNIKAISSSSNYNASNDLWKPKPVEQLSISSNTVLRVYSSAAAAVEQMQISQGCISKCCRGRRKSAYGFRWRFYTGPPIGCFETANIGRMPLEQLRMLKDQRTEARTGSKNSNQGDDCESLYLHSQVSHVLLDSEIRDTRISSPSTRTSEKVTSSHLLNFQKISESPADQLSTEQVSSSFQYNEHDKKQSFMATKGDRKRAVQQIHIAAGNIIYCSNY